MQLLQLLRLMVRKNAAALLLHATAQSASLRRLELTFRWSRISFTCTTRLGALHSPFNTACYAEQQSKLIRWWPHGQPGFGLCYLGGFCPTKSTRKEPGNDERQRNDEYDGVWLARDDPDSNCSRPRDRGTDQISAQLIEGRMNCPSIRPTDTESAANRQKPMVINRWSNTVDF